MTGFSHGGVARALRYPERLAKAGRWAEFHSRLADYHFIEAKMQCLGTRAIIEDYDNIPKFDTQDGTKVAGQGSSLDWESLRLIQSVLQISEGALTSDWRQLPSQLIGRLKWCDREAVANVLAEAASGPGEPWLRPRTPSLIAAGSGVGLAEVSSSSRNG